MDEIIAALFVVGGIIILAIGLSLIMAFPVMLCWNYAVTTIFGLPTISWGQAWCLTFLAHVLLKGSITTKK